MNEDDRLKSLMQEWQAPDPSPPLDTAMREKYMKAVSLPWWRRIWTVRVSIPVPALAALLLVLGLWLQFGTRRVAAPARVSSPPEAAYVTEIDGSGFKPLPDGEIRVIRAGGKAR